MNERRNYYAVRGMKKFSGYIVHSVEGRGEEDCMKRSVFYIYDEDGRLVAWQDTSPCSCCERPPVFDPFKEANHE